MTRKIYQMMKMSESILNDYELLRNLSIQSKQNHNRTHAIKWIKEIVSMCRMSSEIRDTSIQIFDKYLALALPVYPEILLDTTSLPIASACSLILGTKTNENNSVLSTASFPHFEKEKMVEYEYHILDVINFSIVPQATPSSFIHELLKICPCDVIKDLSLLMKTADQLVEKFMQEPEYLLYAPSTIAISALLLSFLHLEINCNEWLKYVPDYCLPTASNPFFSSLPSQHKSKLLDVDGCLQCFQSIIISSTRSSTPLPSEDHQYDKLCSSQSPISITTESYTGNRIQHAPNKSSHNNMFL